MFKLLTALFLCLLVATCPSCGGKDAAVPGEGLASSSAQDAGSSTVGKAAAEKSVASQSKADLLVTGAMEQVGKTTEYDSSYVKLGYPGGDVPINRGVCTDVVVRALRKTGVDLQVLIHEDMKKSFESYPNLWGLSRPDPNIDHRRVPNIATYLRRKGKAVAITKNPQGYIPGDIVVWRLPSGRPHIGVVSNLRVRGTQRHKVVHNIGSGTQLSDVLFRFEITDHFRYF